MKNSVLLLLVLMLTSCGSQQPDAPDAPSEPEGIITEQQKELILNKVEALPSQAQLAIAIIDDGEVSYFGIKREKDSTLVIRNHDRVFEIGSITKVFTGTLLAGYVVEDKVALGDRINDELNLSLKNDVEISFEQLATHTSGLPRVPASLDSVSLENPYKEFGEEALKKYLTEDLVMLQDPGEQCDYSNLGGGLLGYVLSKVAQTTYEGMLQERIFSKYKMLASTTIRKEVAGNLVMGLNDKGEEVPNWDMSVLMGAGGILSTVEDLSKFAIAQFDSTNRELALSRTDHFKVSDQFSMGLGWSVIKSESGADWNWHNGGTGGYTSSMIVDVKAKNAVVILSNVSALGELTGNVTSLSPELMNVIGGE